jgi:hypothetical protein
MTNATLILGKFIYVSCGLLLLAIIMGLAPSVAFAGEGILDIKEGYCFSIHSPAVEGNECFSQIYFRRDGDEKLYVCTARIFSKTGYVYNKAPDQIDCFPIGIPPGPGALELKSLGYLLSRVVGDSESNNKLSSYPWRTGMWMVSKKSRKLSFCVWDDEIPNPKLQCVQKIDWNKLDENGVDPFRW